MGIFNTSTPANTEAVKLGAAAIRSLKTDLNTLLGTLFEDDGTPKDNTVSTDEITDLAVTSAKLADGAVRVDKIADGALTANSTGRAKMVDAFITLAKILDGIFTADATGRAKFAASFVNAALIEADAVTTVKILDGAVSLAKLASDVGLVQAIGRWTGAGYHQNVVSKTLPGSNKFTVSSFAGTLPELGVGVTLQNAPCGIIVNNVTATGADPTSGAAWNWGQMYYIYAYDSVTISLHTSPQGAIDGTTGIVATGAGPMTGSGTYYLKFLDPSTVYKRGCDIVPVISSSSSSKLHGYRAIWRTAWTDSDSGLVQVEQHYPSSSNSNTIEALRPAIITAADTTFCYIVDGNNDWKTGSTDYDVSVIQGKAGSNMITAFI